MIERTCPLSFSVACMYRSVIMGVLWPKKYCIILGLTLFAARVVAAVCLMS